MGDPQKLDKARAVAKRGPSPGQSIVNARMPSLRSEVSMMHFKGTKGPVAPRDELYPGTKRLTRGQQAITGQGEDPEA